eukprot:8173312-Lingulodinium_polyedra.AAC.1
MAGSSRGGSEAQRQRGKRHVSATLGSGSPRDREQLQGKRQKSTSFSTDACMSHGIVHHTPVDLFSERDRRRGPPGGGHPPAAPSTLGTDT